MNIEEIHTQLDAMAADAVAKNDEMLLPGVILVSQDTYLRHHIPTEITSIIRGMRFRGVRLWVSRQYEDQILTRTEALAAFGERLGEFEALEPKA
jgi:hypothetical protein